MLASIDAVACSLGGLAEKGRMLLEEDTEAGKDALCMLAACPSSFYRIPRAQADRPTQVAVCCFDKTGTLTSDNMVLRGLASLADRGDQLVDDIKTAGKDTLRVLAACQSLIQIDGELVGDPLERAAFEATGEHAAQGCACSSAVFPRRHLRGAVCSAWRLQSSKDESTVPALHSPAQHTRHRASISSTGLSWKGSHAHPRRRVCDHSGCPCAGWSMSGGAVVSPKEGSHCASPAPFPSVSSLAAQPCHAIESGLPSWLCHSW